MLTIELEADYSEVQDLLDRVTKELTRPNLRGEPETTIITDFKNQIRRGRFAPISSATRALRKRGGSKPLNVTGALLRSIGTTMARPGQIAVGSRIRKAGLLRYGGMTAASSAIPGKRVPRRDFLGVSQKLLNGVAEALLERIE